MKGMPCKPPAPVLVIDANSDLLSVTREFISKQSVILGKEPYVGNNFLLKDGAVKRSLSDADLNETTVRPPLENVVLNEDNIENKVLNDDCNVAGRVKSDPKKLCTSELSSEVNKLDGNIVLKENINDKPISSK